MYQVNVANLSKSASSYDAARKTVRELVLEVANRVKDSANFKVLRPVFRSSKAAMNEVTNRLAQARNIADGEFKVPSKAGSYTGKVGSASWSITRH